MIENASQLFMWHRLVPMDQAMNVAGRRHDERSARVKPGTSFKLLGIKTFKNLAVIAPLR